MSSLSDRPPAGAGFRCRTHRERSGHSPRAPVPWEHVGPTKHILLREESCDRVHNKRHKGELLFLHRSPHRPRSAVAAFTRRGPAHPTPWRPRPPQARWRQGPCGRRWPARAHRPCALAGASPALFRVPPPHIARATATPRPAVSLSCKCPARAGRPRTQVNKSLQSIQAKLLHGRVRPVRLQDRQQRRVNLPRARSDARAGGRCQTPTRHAEQHLANSQTDISRMRARPRRYEVGHVRSRAIPANMRHRCP